MAPSPITCAASAAASGKRKAGGYTYSLLQIHILPLQMAAQSLASAASSDMFLTNQIERMVPALAAVDAAAEKEYVWHLYLAL